MNVNLRNLYRVPVPDYEYESSQEAPVSYPVHDNLLAIGQVHLVRIKKKEVVRIQIKDIWSSTDHNSEYFQNEHQTKIN